MHVVYSHSQNVPSPDMGPWPPGRLYKGATYVPSLHQHKQDPPYFPMPAQMRKFPTEIFIAIFSFLPPRDLISVIRLCKALIGVGRPLLYRSVDLKSDGRHIRSTVRLLQQDNELSRNIMHATLTTRQPCKTSQWIPPDFLNRWNNLRSLKLVGFPFRTRKDQEIFRNTLTGSCTALVHLACQPDASPFPGESFEISGLKQLSWKTEQKSK